MKMNDSQVTQVAQVAKVTQVAQVAKVTQVAQVAKVTQVAQVAKVTQVTQVAQVAKVAQQIDVPGQLERAELYTEINNLTYKRLLMLYYLLIRCEKEGLVTMKITDFNDTQKISWFSPDAVNCILGFKELTVNDPRKLYDIILKVINENKGNIFPRYNLNVRNLTWVVYKLFRNIGLQQDLESRGPKETDPGKGVMFYYYKWTFVNDISFREKHNIY